MYRIYHIFCYYYDNLLFFNNLCLFAFFFRYKVTYLLIPNIHITTISSPSI